MLEHRRLRFGACLMLVAVALASLGTSHPAQAATALFVADNTNNSVKRYDGVTGAYDVDFVAGGSGGLHQPQEPTFGPDGHLYVVSGGTSDVKRYNGTTGAFIDTFASGTGVFDPIGAQFGPDGNLYVTGGNGDQVKRFDGVTGAFIDDFIASGLDNPAGLRFGPDGHLYVANYYLNRISRFNGVTGAFIDAFVPAGSGNLTLPTGLTFGPDGHLYVSSQTNADGPGRVKRYDGTTGAFLGDFAVGSGLTNPGGLAFGPDGHLYVPNIDEVKRYDGATGAFIDNFVSAGSGGLTNGAWLTFGPPDSDGDGVPDNEDECPNSDLSATVVIDGCDSGVPNTLFPSGCTIADLITECAENANNHGQFVSCVAHVSNSLKKAGTITGQQQGAIQSCAAPANIP